MEKLKYIFLFLLFIPSLSFADSLIFYHSETGSNSDTQVTATQSLSQAFTTTQCYEVTKVQFYTTSFLSGGDVFNVGFRRGTIPSSSINIGNQNFEGSDQSGGEVFWNNELIFDTPIELRFIDNYFLTLSSSATLDYYWGLTDDGSGGFINDSNQGTSFAYRLYGNVISCDTPVDNNLNSIGILNYMFTILPKTGVIILSILFILFLLFAYIRYI